MMRRYFAPLSLIAFIAQPALADTQLSGADTGEIVSQESPGRSCVGVFWPIQSEPRLQDCFIGWARRGIRLALPVTPPVPAPLTFAAWQPGESMTADPMGIQTPVRRDVVKPDCLVIPCLGYGDDGLRLGYGGGYYYRTLSDFDGPTIGVAFAETYLPGLRAQARDCLLDIIVTD